MVNGEDARLALGAWVALDSGRASYPKAPAFSNGSLSKVSVGAVSAACHERRGARIFVRIHGIKRFWVWGAPSERCVNQPLLRLLYLGQ